MTGRFSFELIPLDPHEIMWIVFSGEPTLPDLAEAFGVFSGHPSYHAGLDEILDFSNASLRQLSSRDVEQIRRFLSRREDRSGTRQAAVVDADLDFGLYRMFDSLVDGSVHQQRGVFRSLEEALTWLRPDDAQNLLLQCTSPRPPHPNEPTQ